MGGRQARTDPAYGHIYDHFAIEYEYPKGARVASYCRQIDGTDARVSEFVEGTKGTSTPANAIQGESTYRFKKTGAPGPYEQEHIDLINSIRAGKPLNEAKRIAESTLTAIMGRMSAYSGKLVTWEQAMNSQLDTFPKGELAFGDIPVPPVPIPGKHPLV
jgi:hypothetical protein